MASGKTDCPNCGETPLWNASEDYHWCPCCGTMVNKRNSYLKLTPRSYWQKFIVNKLPEPTPETC